MALEPGSAPSQPDNSFSNCRISGSSSSRCRCRCSHDDVFGMLSLDDADADDDDNKDNDDDDNDNDDDNNDDDDNDDRFHSECRRRCIPKPG